jgi:hypothetical protein
MYDGDYYPTHYQQRGTLSRQGMAGFLEGFDGEHLVLCLVSALAVYTAGYIIARLFYAGIMFFLSVGLIVFLVMQVVDGVDSGVGAAKYRYTHTENW